jgi:hypothetical protein
LDKTVSTGLPSIADSRGPPKNERTCSLLQVYLRAVSGLDMVGACLQTTVRLISLFFRVSTDSHRCCSCRWIEQATGAWPRKTEEYCRCRHAAAWAISSCPPGRHVVVVMMMAGTGARQSNTGPTVSVLCVISLLPCYCVVQCQSARLRLEYPCYHVVQRVSVIMDAMRRNTSANGRRRGVLESPPGSSDWLKVPLRKSTSPLPAWCAT